MLRHAKSNSLAIIYRNELGDQIKIGRRGGYNGIVTVFGKEGHSAWPNRTINPVSGLIKMLTKIDKKVLDK